MTLTQLKETADASIRRLSSDSEVAFNAVFIFFICAVSIIAALFVIYIVGVGFKEWFGIDNNFEPQRSEASRVAIDAGLLGMTLDERKMVIDKLLQSTTYTEKNKKKQKPCGTGVEKVCVDESCDSYRSSLSCGISCSSIETFLADTETSCLICMMDYVEGDDLVTGKHCGHKFHRRCLLEWLGEGNHDECPLCREPIMTPSEFRDSASKNIRAKRLQRIATISAGRSEHGSNNTGIRGLGSLFFLPSIRTDSNTTSTANGDVSDSV